jgi:hypothetical protein
LLLGGLTSWFDYIALHCIHSSEGWIDFDILKGIFCNIVLIEELFKKHLYLPKFVIPAKAGIHLLAKVIGFLPAQE